MSDSTHIPEKALYEVWAKNLFNSSLQTTNGDEIEIINPGHLNTNEAGPDFMNARIRIGNLSYVGDVEIDINYNDWKNHGHNINKRYNKVILHVCLFNKFNQNYVYSVDGRKIPILVIGNKIDSSLVDLSSFSSTKNIKNNKTTLRCSFEADRIDKQKKVEFITALGIKRFNAKCERIYSRLKELIFLKELNINEPVIRYELTPEFKNKEFTYDDFKDRELWQQTFYEFVFEALGYSQNKIAMLKLAQNADVHFLKSISDSKNFTEMTEAALFQISGLLPNVKELPKEDVSEYTRKLFDNYQTIKDKYTSEFLDETDWHFFKLRPPNFPTIRIMAGVFFLQSLLIDNSISIIIKKITEIRKPEILINSLRSFFIVRSEGYWQNHYVFDKITTSKINYFVGVSRADDILVNVVFPFFSVYFDVFGKNYLSKKILQTYNIFIQKSDNRIERNVAESLNLKEYSHKTLFAQGMIQLYRNYCTKKKCLECEIGKEIFE